MHQLQKFSFIDNVRISVVTLITHYLLLHTKRNLVRQTGLFWKKTNKNKVIIWLIFITFVRLTRTDVTGGCIIHVLLSLSSSSSIFTPLGSRSLLASLYSLEEEHFLSSPLKALLPWNIYSLPFSSITRRKLRIPKPRPSCLGFLSPSGCPKTVKTNFKNDFKTLFEPICYLCSMQNWGPPKMKSLHRRNEAAAAHFLFKRPIPCQATKNTNNSELGFSCLFTFTS